MSSPSGPPFSNGARPRRSRGTVITWVLALVLVVGAAATGVLALTGVLGGSETSAGADGSDDEQTEDRTAVDGPVAPNGTWAPDEWTVTAADLEDWGLEPATREHVFFPRELGVPVIDDVALVQLWGPETLAGVAGVDVATGEHRWTLDLPAQDGFQECALATFDEFVCMGASAAGDGFVFTVDPDTGARSDLWSGEDVMFQTLVSSEGFVTHHDDRVEMYDDEGESLWTIRPDSSLNLRTIALTEDRLVILTPESVSLHDAADGTELWNAPVPSPAMAKILDDGSVLVWNGQSTELFSPEGDQILRQEGQLTNISWFSTAPVDTLVVTDQSSVHAHSTTDGEEIWYGDTGSDTWPVMLDDVVVLTGPDGLTALDVSDGTELWTQDLEPPMVPLTDGTSVLVQQFEDVTAYSPTDGTVEWSVDATDFGITRLEYVTSFNGRVALSGSDADGATITHVFTP